MNKVYASIAAIVVLEAIALLKGIDGALLGLAVAALAGLGGFEVKSWMIKKK